MENHGLGTHNDKMCAEILPQNTYLTIYSAHLPKSANYLGNLKKSSNAKKQKTNFVSWLNLLDE